MDVDNRRFGVGIILIGFFLLLSLRLWASPIAMTITDRSRVSVVAFLSIPLFLLIIGAGIVIFLWGDELGIG
jgi:hypothetical protein